MPLSVFDSAIVPGWTDPAVPAATPGVVFRFTRTDVLGISDAIVYGPTSGQQAMQRLPPSYVQGLLDAYVSRLDYTSTSAQRARFRLHTAPTGSTGVSAGPQLTDAAEANLAFIARADGTVFAFRLADVIAGDTEEPYVWDGVGSAAEYLAFRTALIASVPATVVIVDTSHANVDFANRQVSSALPGTVLSGQTLIGSGTLGQASLTVVAAGSVAVPLSVFDASIVPGWTDPDVANATPGVLWSGENSLAHGNGFVIQAGDANRRAPQRIPRGYWDRPFNPDDMDAYVTRIRLRAGNMEWRMHSAYTNPGGGTGPQFTEAAEEVLGILIRLSDGTELSWLVSDLDDDDETEEYDWDLDHTSSPITAAQAATVIEPGSITIVLVDTSHANIDFANRQVASATPPPAATVLSGQTLTGSGTLGQASLTVAAAGATVTAQTIISAPGFDEAADPVGVDTYGFGEVIQIQITYSAPVEVTGTPQLPFNFGQSPVGGPELMDYASGSGTTQIVFERVILASDLDTNGVFIYGDGSNNDAIVLNGGTIRNAGTTVDADLNTVGSGTQVGARIDGALRVPTVLSGRTLTGSGTLGQASLTVVAAGATVVSGQTLTGSGTLGQARLTAAAAATVPRVNIDPQDLTRPVMALAGDRWLGGAESATQRLRDALVITRGSYPVARDYGSTLADVLDRPLHAGGQAALMAAVADTVAHRPNGLDDVRLRSVAVRTEDGVTTLDIRADWVSESGAITPIGLREQLAGR